jgi:hypothetical protein
MKCSLRIPKNTQGLGWIKEQRARNKVEMFFEKYPRIPKGWVKTGGCIIKMIKLMH